jgi:hypothetical protein
MRQKMPLTKLSFVVFLAATALPRVSSAQAQQPLADRAAAAAPQVDLSGRWRFGTFGSFWTVDLKLGPKTADDEKVWCGEAARDRLMPDTPIVKARLCAEIDPDDGQLHVEVSGATCKAQLRSAGMLDGTCSMRGGMAMSMSVAPDDDATAGPMATPMGRFTAMRVAAGAKR